MQLHSGGAAWGCAAAARCRRSRLAGCCEVAAAGARVSVAAAVRLRRVSQLGVVQHLGAADVANPAGALGSCLGAAAGARVGMAAGVDVQRSSC
jgi:hypothetical protein